MKKLYPDWSLEAAISYAARELPGIWRQSWFRFEQFFFGHKNFYDKNEKLWTGFYTSQYGFHEKKEVSSGRFDQYED